MIRLSFIIANLHSLTAEKLVCKELRAFDEFHVKLNANMFPQVGCCPDSVFGQPYRLGQDCCCDTIYKTGEHFCCMLGEDCRDDAHVLQETTLDRSRCRHMKACHDVPHTDTTRHTCIPTGDDKDCEFTCKQQSERMIGSDSNQCISGEWEHQEPPCCTEECVKEESQMELVIAIDRSASVGEANFELMKEIISNATGQFENVNATAGIRISLILFDDDVQEMMALDEGVDEDALADAFFEAEFKFEGSEVGNLTLVVQWINEFAFIDMERDEEDDEELDENNKLPGNELPEKKKVARKVVIFTDGEVDATLTDEMIEKMHNNTEVFVVGVGEDVDEDDLKTIATKRHSNHLRMFESFAEMEDEAIVLQDWLQDMDCATVCEGDNKDEEEEDDGTK